MNPLVQRSILDFMCMCLPISTQQITRTDKINLIVVAIHVILRRDMSLNRRIYAWFMGNSSTTSSTSGSNSGPTSTSSSSNTSSVGTHASLNGASSNSLNSNSVAKNGGGDRDEMSERFATYSEENYFKVHTKGLLIQAIKALLNSRRDASLVQYLFTDESASNSWVFTFFLISLQICEF